jgi:hypothetical protein
MRQLLPLLAVLLLPPVALAGSVALSPTLSLLYEMTETGVDFKATYRGGLAW